MTVFAGQQDTDATPVWLSIQGSVTGKADAAAYTRPGPQPNAKGIVGYDPLIDNILLEMHNLVAGPGKTDHVNGNTFVGQFHLDLANEFFENYHVIPRSFDFGNILSEQTSPLEVFSGYRKTEGTWSSFVNNAGAGTTVTGFPALPATMYPLEGYTGTLVVSTSGAPTVDDDLAFEFDFGGTTIYVPITLNRIVLFPVRPEIPYVEKLQFLTDIIRSALGEEQRIALRKNPRQLFEWNVRVDAEEWDKQRLEVLLYDWQQRTWGIPMWHEQTELTVAASAGALTINVDSTANADYRVGGLALIFTDGQNFDVQTIASTTATTITFDNALIGSYGVGTVVCPLRAGFMKRRLGAARWPTTDMNLQVSFTTTDNDANLGDTTGLSTYNSKVMLDDHNVVLGGQVSDTYEKEIIVLDNLTGTISQESPWDYGKRGSSLTLYSNSKAQTWTWRKFLHAMKGRQVSFYVPTFNKDLPINTALSSASQDLVIDNIGYVQFIDRKPGKKHIWVRLNDGTVITKEIISAVETSTSIETLTVDSVWGSNIAVADIDRISFLEEIRYNSDEITLNHNRGERTVHISAPILTVFDDS